MSSTEHEAPKGLLAADGLSIRFPHRYGQTAVVDQVDLRLEKGECLGVVGESGCGKSLLCLGLADLLPRRAETSGVVSFHGAEVRNGRTAAVPSFHGKGVGFIYQDAMTSLNPGMRVGAQLRQVCRLGASAPPEDLLRQVELTDVERIMRAYPHQLSGGQRQRVLFALALARQPEVVVADEPTTAVDVTVQAQLVRLLRSLQAKNGFGLVFSSHDLALIGELADRVAVMYSGQLVELGTTQRILRHPQHPYTAALMAASSSLDDRGFQLASVPGSVRQPADYLGGCRFRDRCERATDKCGERPLFEERETAVACWHPLSPGDDRISVLSRPLRTATQIASSSETVLEVDQLTVTYRDRRRGPFTAVSNVNLTVASGEVLGIIGESGSGKSTLARAILGLERPAAGSVHFLGHDVARLDDRQRRTLIGQQAAMVFQDPRSSLNQRLSVEAVIVDPLVVHGIGSRSERAKRAADLLDEVGLPPAYAQRPVRTLSGGQLQRVAIARALVLEPRLVVADEPTSALDVSVQSQILNLLERVRREWNLAMLIISHDMRVIRYVADRTAVMLRGDVVESGPTEDLYTNPQHDYTRSLVSATPTLDDAAAKGAAP